MPFAREKSAGLKRARLFNLCLRRHLEFIAEQLTECAKFSVIAQKCAGLDQMQVSLRQLLQVAAERRSIQ